MQTELKKRLLFHFKMLKTALNENHLCGYLNVDNFQVSTPVENQHYIFFPQFSRGRGHYKEYSSEFTVDARGFIGWRPYENREMVIFKNKLTWRKQLQQAGFSVPPHALETRLDFGNVIIKPSVSSFSEGIKGPYKNGHPFSLEPGEFLEKFIEGAIVKIWFWVDQPVCLEMQKMPEVVGDGKQTIRELLMSRFSEQEEATFLPKVKELLAYYARTLDTRLASGEVQIIDFRYGSDFAHPADIIEILLNEIDFDLQAVLDELGKTIWDMMSVETSLPLAWTVDAIWDAQDQLWILEVNTNPFIHPWLYPSMVHSLCAGAYRK